MGKQPPRGKPLPNMRGWPAKKRADFETALTERCPQFDHCSVNVCPLDPLAGQRETHPEDSEKKCRAERPTRLRIVEEARAEGVSTVAYLPWGGLTLKEWNAAGAADRFEALPEEEKAARRDRMREVRAMRSGLHLAQGSGVETAPENLPSIPRPDGHGQGTLAESGAPGAAPEGGA